MTGTASTMLPLGTEIPSFELPDVVTGDTVGVQNLNDAKLLLVMFICNHCPYVKHVLSELGRLGHDYADGDLAIVAINSNDVEAYPADGPDQMKELATGEGWRFPFLYDESQDVAKSFRAACTPDFFVFDNDRLLVYRGQLDDSRPGNDRPVTGRDLRSALDSVLAGAAVAADQTPSMGCNIKWRADNAPDYFAS